MVKISRRAAEARVKRRVANDGHVLVKVRKGSHGWLEQWPYMVIDPSTRAPVSMGETLEWLAKEYEVLKSWEEIEPED